VLLAACASRTTPEPTATAGAAVVHNSIRIGLIRTTLFVVDSVDGSKVHEKLDFKRRVEVAAGKREITVAYYTDALWGSRESSETCRIVFDAEPNGIYNLLGEAERDDWRARLVNSRTSRESPCLFPDEVGSAANEVDAHPPGKSADSIGAVAHVAPSETNPTAVVAATGGNTDVIRANAAQPTGRSSRRRSFCPSGYYRVAHFDGDATFVLERSDRIRMIGIQADPTAAKAPEKEGMRVEGKCVRFDYEPTNLIDGHRDRDGYLLAYVYLEDGTFVNVELIREGRFRATSERHQHLAAFLAAQSEARKSSR
jgi:endonuclease YncB( thermonuclease family)